MALAPSRPLRSVPSISISAESSVRWEPTSKPTSASRELAVDGADGAEHAEAAEAVAAVAQLDGLVGPG